MIWESKLYLELENLGRIHDIALNIRWDAASFAKQVERRAAVLLHMDIGRGSIVTIAHSGSARFFADLFAVWRVGAAAACLDKTLTNDELQLIVRFCKSPALLIDGEAATRDLPIPILDLKNAPPISSVATKVNPDPDDPALVLFTSGTTGAAKGVVLTFRALSARLSLNRAAIGRAALARALVTLPTHFGHGLIGNALTPLVAGGDIVLHPLGMSLAQRLGGIIDEYDISFLSSVPALWHLATRHSRPPARGSLIRVHIGSAPLSADLWSQAAAWSSAEVVNCYGMTETANWIAGASSRTDAIADGLVGKPWGCRVGIMNDNGHIGQTGDGELLVQSPAVMSGYLNRPDLTARVMTDGWLHTGDRGTVDEQGRIWLTGRIKDEINRAGFKIQPAEIDLLLERHPSVAEACVFGIADPVSGETVAAAVRPASGEIVSAPALQAWCRERLRQEAVPEHWFIVDDIPRSTRGKVSRDAVRRILVPLVEVADSRTGVASSDAPAETAPGAEAEPNHASALRVRDIVERAWTAVLGHRSFAANLPWDEAGGDSLNTMRLWFHIEEELGVRLPLEVLEPGTTPDMFIAAIEKALGPSAAVSADDTHSAPPMVFFLPGLMDDVPLLVRFREAFKGKVQFAVIHYPTWKEMIGGGGSFDKIVQSAVAQIRTQPHQDVYLLLGCSFGGFVAWEVARHLLESGERVGLICLVDTRRKNEPSKPKERLLLGASGRIRRLVTQPNETFAVLLRRLFTSLTAIPALRTSRPNDAQQAHEGQLAKTSRRLRRLVLRPTEAFAILLQRVSISIAALLLNVSMSLAAMSQFRLLKVVAYLGMLLPPKVSFNYYMMLMRRLRTHAVETWQFEALDVSATLFRSEEAWPKPYDYGWSALCNRLTVIKLEGSHGSIYEVSHCQTLCSRILEIVEVARRHSGDPSTGVTSRR